MPDTLPNIPVPANVWSDVYTTAGIPIGTPIDLSNLGTCDVYLAVQKDEPEQDHDSYSVLQRLNGRPMTLDVGATGLWAFCVSAVGKLGVSIAETLTDREISEAILDQLRKINCNQVLMIDEIGLLNLRTEEAFQTGLNENDL